MTKLEKKVYESFFVNEADTNYLYLKNKKPELHFDYDELKREAHHKAFTVAKVTKLDLLKDIQSSLVKANKEGLPFEEWRDSLKPTLAKKGWLGEVELTNPNTGETKKIYVGNRRLKTIYSTNMRVANAKARYETQMDSFAEYFRYVAVLDNLTRATHAKHHNLVLPKNHPFWETHYPPNAWNCRCKVQVLTKDELDKKGLKVSSAPQSFVNKDWAYNVGKTDNLASVINSKIDKLEDKKLKDIAQKEFKNLDTLAFKEVAKKQLNEMIDEVIINKNQKYPINYIVVGSLLNTHLKAIKEHLNKDLKEGKIILSKKNLLHSRPERKDMYNHSFRVEEMKQIVDVLDNIDNAYIDTKHNNLLFMFDDKEDKDIVNLIPIEILKNIKKFDGNSYVLTLDKNKRIHFNDNLKNGTIKKLYKSNKDRS